MEYSTLEYGDKRSLVNKNQFWSVKVDEIREIVVKQLPELRNVARNWLSQRPAMTIERQPSSPQSWWRKPDFRQLDRNLYSAAARESSEFVRAVLFEDSNTKDKQNELGDTLFFLLLTVNGFSASEKPEQFLTKTKFGEIPHKYENEIISQIPERVVASALDIVDCEIGQRDDNIVQNSKQVDAMFSFAIYTIFRYAMAVHWDMPEIIDRVKNKNDRHFPIEFYLAETSPFFIEFDSHACLGLFRKFTDPKSGNLYIHELHSAFPTLNRTYTDPNFDVIYFRNWIKNALYDIARLSTADDDMHLVVKHLILEGVWDESTAWKSS